MNRDEIQANWFALIEATSPVQPPGIASENRQPAHAKLAALLREYADKVEQGKPSVFGFYESRNDGPFEEIRVVLSHPWGG